MNREELATFLNKLEGAAQRGAPISPRSVVVVLKALLARVEHLERVTGQEFPTVQSGEPEGGWPMDQVPTSSG